ncbi:hypothetical protein DM01DRAFT_1099323 [Hesseltinella vesiculosa]|uniref:Uncharacterized protein n=1 Tax=Hesseltinella vesiculosa TaxID=101127 RepID=A0A1X2GD48_9FUNG|nr:hypothetical protein DM01DRAFT_1099323 [Hesseltinella vesiculosa]
MPLFMLGCPWRCVCSLVDNGGPCSARAKPRSGLILMNSSAALLFFFKQEAMMHSKAAFSPLILNLTSIRHKRDAFLIQSVLSYQRDTRFC